MLTDNITLWPGGPSLSLGAYFLLFKYAFSILFLAWAIGLSRWPRPRALLGGSLALALFAWVGLNLPLGRPYGLVDSRPGLFELAQPMVSAAQGSVGEGWMARQPNPAPLWSLVLALASGLDPERLLHIYSFTPAVSLLALSGALYWGLGGLEHSLSPVARSGRALAVFFVLFLSSTRLGFLHEPGPLWPQVFGLRPRLGFALGALLIWFRLLSGERRPASLPLTALAWSAVAWLEPRLALVAGAGAVAWTVACWKRPGHRWVAPLSLVAGAFALVLLPVGIEPAEVRPGTGDWPFVFGELAAVTVDSGLVFLLAALALTRMCAGGRPPEVLLVSLVGTSLIFWLAATVSGAAAAWLDPLVLHACFKLLMAASAGLEAYYLIVYLTQAGQIRQQLESLARRLGAHSGLGAGLAFLVALSLPWCFPYWWYPVRMDPLYVESLPPLPRRLEAFGSWLRSETHPRSVFVAGPYSASWIAALGGRRVLFVEGTAPADLPERRRALVRFVESRDPKSIQAAARDWELTHLAWGRLDRDGPVRPDFEYFESSTLFTQLMRQGRFIRVFALRHDSPP